MMNMFDSTCSVFRNTTTKDQEYGRPVKELVLVGTYPCLLSQSRRKNRYSQGKPNASLDNGFCLYGSPDIDIKAGDIVEVNGEKYVASAPYKPANDHIEVDLELKRDA